MHLLSFYLVLSNLGTKGVRTRRSKHALTKTTTKETLANPGLFRIPSKPSNPATKASTIAEQRCLRRSL